MTGRRRSTFATVPNPTTDVEQIVTPPAEPDLTMRRRVLMTVLFIAAIAIVALALLLLHAAVNK